MTQLWSVANGSLMRRVLGTQTLLNTTFDQFSVADPMSISDYRTAMGIVNGIGGTSTVARTAIAAVAGRGNVIRQHFHANQFGTADGIAVAAELSQSVEEAVISYDVRFNTASFDWGWGGKMPGLGGILPGQGNPPAGGSPSSYGWSCRGMWITPGSYPGSSNTSNEWIGYMYDPTQSAGNYGQNRQTNQSFIAGQWHTVKQYYKMNSINIEGSSGNANGIHRMYLDGVLVYENTAQVYRIYEAAKITHLCWSQFYGGNTVDWAPAIDTDIDIDNLSIRTGTI